MNYIKNYLNAKISNVLQIRDRIRICSKSLKHYFIYNKINPYFVYYVSTEDIRYFQTGCIGQSPFTRLDRGTFDKYTPLRLDGNWDTQVTSIFETFVYQGLYQHFILKHPWDKTFLYPDNQPPCHPVIGMRWRNIDKKKFYIQTDYIEKLFISIAKRGCVSQNTLGGSFWDEITVNISRDGSFIRNSSGQHRLILSQILGISHVPVRFLIIHNKYNENISYKRRVLP